MPEILTEVEQLAGQREQLAAQNQTLQKQNFEDTFFQLLRLHNDILNTMSLDLGAGNVKLGRDAFRAFYSRFGDIFSGREVVSLPDYARIKESYKRFFQTYQSRVGHYFYTLESILRFVKHSKVVGEEKRFYANLVRAQLSSDELVLLFYHCLSDLGSEKFKPLVEEYGLLRNLPNELLLNPQDHGSLFNGTAYSE